MNVSESKAYLALAEYVAMFIMLCGSTVLCALVLIKQHRAKQSLSHMLTASLYVILLENVLAMGNVVYMIAYWSKDPNYDGVIVYFTGILTFTVLVQYEVTTFFLFIERIFTLNFTFWFTRKRYKWLVASTFVFGPLALAPMVWLSVQYPIVKTTKKNCWAINCAVANFENGYFIYAKLALALLNCFAGFVFVFSFRKHRCPNRKVTIGSTTIKICSLAAGKQKKSNTVVMYSFTLSLILDIIPAIVDVVLNQVADIRLAYIVGPYSRLGSFTGIFISTCIYYRMFCKSTAS